MVRSILRFDRRFSARVLASRLLFGLSGFALVLPISSAALARDADVTVCVDVVVQRPTEKAAPRATKPSETTPGGAAPAEAARPPFVQAAEPESPQPAKPSEGKLTTGAAADSGEDARAKSGARLPLGQTPDGYLKRLLEYFVTHERGFVAVPQGCQQKILVELYPLRVGWTAFARYSGTGREERVDQLLPTELSQFAERAALSLLRDVPITETVDRGNVLAADSLKATQSIRGRGHVVVGLGTRVRAGRFDTVVEDPADGAVGSTSQQLRVFTPMLMTVLYRGQFEEFGVEAGGELDIGTNVSSARSNPAGGHIDYGGSTGLVLHAVRYTNVRGLTSIYYGGGATFALHWFSAIRPEAERVSDSRSTLLSGGLDIDAVLGYEFMRASAISFFLQGELNLPAYTVKNSDSSGSINTWFPGAAFKVGAAF
jgi:hypothetical protein